MSLCIGSERFAGSWPCIQAGITHGRQSHRLIEPKKIAGSLDISSNPGWKVAAFMATEKSALRAAMDENERQAKTLADLRDTLLPRLISGQLRLSVT